MNTPLPFDLRRIATPMGELLMITDQQGSLRALDWNTHAARMRRLLDLHYGPGTVHLSERAGPHPILAKLNAYLAGDLAAINDIITTTAGTSFQRTVWTTLKTIPAGKTWTYTRLAASIGRPSAIRAVGLANGANPIAIVVPCHRVIGTNGSMTGYGGGLDRKRWLLQHEGFAHNHLAA